MDVTELFKQMNAAEASTEDNKAKRTRYVYFNLGGSTAFRIEVWDRPMRDGNQDFNTMLNKLDAPKLQELIALVAAKGSIEVKELTSKAEPKEASSEMNALLEAFSK